MVAKRGQNESLGIVIHMMGLIMCDKLSYWNNVCF